MMSAKFLSVFAAGTLFATSGHASNQALASQLFQEYCVAPGSRAASETAIRASGKFGKRTVLETGTSKYVSYAIPGVRGVISVIYGSGTGIQCSVGIDNKGPTLFENGSIDPD